MIKVGLTGGIGSGKTLICNIFSKMGIAIFNADMAAIEIMEKNHAVKNQIIEIMGTEIYFPDGLLDRKTMAALIFNTKEKLDQLSKIVHPLVRAYFQHWAEEQNSPYVIQETAILFENKLEYLFDLTITVTAPVDIRIERVIKRDSAELEQVLSRVKNQLPDEEKILKSNYIIYNDGSKMILPQVINIHNKILQWQNSENG